MFFLHSLWGFVAGQRHTCTEPGGIAGDPEHWQGQSGDTAGAAVGGSCLHKFPIHACSESQEFGRNSCLACRTWLASRGRGVISPGRCPWMRPSRSPWRDTAAWSMLLYSQHICHAPALIFWRMRFVHSISCTDLEALRLAAMHSTALQVALVHPRVSLASPSVALSERRSTMS